MPSRIALSRFAGLMVALLFHLLIFFLVRNLVIQPAPAERPADPSVFQLVKIAPPAPPPTLPPPPPTLPNLSGGAVSPTITIPIVTTPQAKINLPVPEVPDIKTLDLPKVASLPLPDTTTPAPADAGSGQGQGSSTGDSNSPGTSGNSGGGAKPIDIIGIPIANGENLIVALDTSRSMDLVDIAVKAALKKSLPTSQLIDCGGCRGHYTLGTPLPPAGSATPPNWDIYYDVYQALDPKNIDPKNPPTAVLLVTDFEDGSDMAACQAFVDYLRGHFIRLYIYSVELPPYPLLEAYATESGGQVYTTTKSRATHYHSTAEAPMESPPSITNK